MKVFSVDPLHLKSQWLGDGGQNVKGTKFCQKLYRMQFLYTTGLHKKITETACVAMLALKINNLGPPF